MTRIARACAIAAAALLCLAGCDKTTPIRTLLDDPARFDGQQVRIAGEVTDAIGIFGLGTYQVDDGTGTIRVVAQEGGVPRQGAKVGVEGTFRSAFTVGTESLAVLVESRRATP